MVNFNSKMNHSHVSLITCINFTIFFRMRRVGYGNSTHLNMSVIVGGDNKAIIQVALDRQDKDYFACDAGKLCFRMFLLNSFGLAFFLK